MTDFTTPAETLEPAGTVQDAIVLAGANVVIPYPRFVSEAAKLGLVVLGLDTEQGASRLRAGDMGPNGAIGQADPDDPASVLAVIRQWQDGYRIRGVLAAREAWVEAAGSVTTLLGLPSLGHDASLVSRNKWLQRQLFVDISPRFRAVRAADRDEVAQSWQSFPVVVKPIARSGSSGVWSVHDSGHLREAFGNLLPGETALIEELIEGPEYTVETLVQGGKIIFASASGKRTTEREGRSFVELAHTIPADQLDEPIAAALLEANRTVVERLRTSDGMLHSEYRVRSDGTVMLTEINGRCPGDMALTLYYLASGAPMEKALIEVACGRPASYPLLTRIARVVYLDHQPGPGLRQVWLDGAEFAEVPVRWIANGQRLPTIKPTEHGMPGAVHLVTVSKPRGTRLQPLRSSDDRSVSFLIDARTAAELSEVESRIRDAIRLHHEESANATN